MYLFATCGGCVTGMHWNAVFPKDFKSTHQEIRGTIQSPPGNKRNHPEPTRKEQSFRIPEGSEIFLFRNYSGRNCPLASLSPPLYEYTRTQVQDWGA